MLCAGAVCWCCVLVLVLCAGAGAGAIQLLTLMQLMKSNPFGEVEM